MFFLEEGGSAPILFGVARKQLSSNTCIWETQLYRAPVSEGDMNFVGAALMQPNWAEAKESNS